MTKTPSTSPAAATALFLRRWLRAPARMGAVAPSSRYLARAMAQAALGDRPAQRGLVVELGPGTGRITEGLLAAGLPPENLLAIERDGELAAFLHRKFPRIEVLSGDAAQLSGILGGRQVVAVVSSLPLLSLGNDLVRQILGAIAQVLPSGGALTQYTYGRNSPVAPELSAILNLDGRRVGRVWRNLPPAAIWQFRKR